MIPSAPEAPGILSVARSKPNKAVSRTHDEVQTRPLNLRFVRLVLRILPLVGLVVDIVGNSAFTWRRLITVLSHSPTLWLLLCLPIVAQICVPLPAPPDLKELITRDDDPEVISELNEFLTQSTARARELFDGLPIACCTFDISGHILEWNRANTALYGQEPCHVIDRSFAHLTRIAPVRQQAENVISRVAGGESVEAEEWTIPIDEINTAYHVLYAYPLHGPDGAVVGAIAATVDVTDRKRGEEATRAAKGEMEKRIAESTLEMREINKGLHEKIAELLATQRALQESHQRATFLADSMPHIVWTANSDGQIDYFNQTWYDYTNLSKEQAKEWGRKLSVHSDDLVRCIERWARSLETGEPYEVEYRLRRALDGAYRWHLDRARAMRDENSQIVMWVGATTDIDDKKRAEEQLREANDELERRVAQRTSDLALANETLLDEIEVRQFTEHALHESESRFRSAIAALQEGLIVTTADGSILVCNRSAEEILGSTRDELTSKRQSGGISTMVNEDLSPLNSADQPTAIAMTSGQVCSERVVGVCKPTGELVWLSQTAVPLFHVDAAEPYATVLTFSDITERKRIQAQLNEQMEQLHLLATSDGLTGLSNHRAFQVALHDEVRRVERFGNQPSLLMIDVDHFKAYNDAYGHPAGDYVLRLIATVLNSAAGSMDLAARYGGEEFAVILPETDCESALATAEDFRLAIERAPWPLRGVTASFGAATLTPGMTPEDLVKAADAALYAAKAAGRNTSVHANAISKSLPKAA